MSTIQNNIKCSPGRMVIERKHLHRFRLEERLVFEGIPCVRVSPLDKGFERDRTAIWPEGWVYLPGQQMDLFPEDAPNPGGQP